MARSRMFVPSFDRLGLRIAPSNATMTGFAAEANQCELLPDDSELPGTDSSIEDTITWDVAEDPTAQGQRESYLASVDWMLPMTNTTPN